MTAARAVQTVSLNYASRSGLARDESGARVRLALDRGRGVVGLRGRLRDAALVRDALLATWAVLESDLRYKGRDRTAYLAYLMKQGKRATAQIWEAQKAYLEKAFAEDTRQVGALDPVLTVDPDGLSIEVFSRDESAYARLFLSNECFDEREAAPGTAFVDLNAEFVGGLERLRSHTPALFEAGVAPAGPPGPGSSRELEVAQGWLRGFLQVQSAATLPSASCRLAPVDVYNVLYALRVRKAKTSPRALRFELVPGLPPRLVLEPWERLLEAHGPAYEGGEPKVVRTFGRQRLLCLAPLLPHLRSARVRLLGAGLPWFLVFDLGPATLSVALTGWAESSWASAASFDLLMPRPVGAPAERAFHLLNEKGPLPLPAVAAALGLPAGEARAALQHECLRGRVLYDLANDAYRPRQLLPSPVDEGAIRFGSEREARAHRLLGDGGAGAGEVRLTKLHDMGGEGTEVHGEVADREAHRTYAPRFTLDNEGRVGGAACTCATYQRSGLREGPCEHLIALRLAYARKLSADEAARRTPEGRSLILAETRTYVRRDAAGAETVYRVSLDRRAVHVRWGARAGNERHQRLWFDSDREAREAYFRRLDALAAEGYVDADASAV
ncbi:MAG TPA: SWIM zinc finger family protein [Polyangiaceae bacterium]|nr:SWIM zinc finger family protein [Polyangiaceae bacterium]